MRRQPLSRRVAHGLAVNPSSSPVAHNARAIIVADEQVALIERKRGAEHFFVFPGGSVEPGKTSDQAVAREVEEEVGLIVRPVRIVAEVTFPDRVQAYWLAEIDGGEFGTGTGLEVTGKFGERHGTYRPTWMPITDLIRHNVLPRSIAVELVPRQVAGWPKEMLRFSDDLMWWRTT